MPAALAPVVGPAAPAWVEARLAPIAHAWETQPEARARLAWHAYLFSALSARAPLPVHERAYAALAREFPEPSARASAPAMERALFRARAGGLARAKARAAARASAIIAARAPEAWETDGPALRAWAASNLPGLAWAKGSFFAMLLGRLDVACLDVHMARHLRIRGRRAPDGKGRGNTGIRYPTLDSKGGYLRAEARLKREARAIGARVGAYQWAAWVQRMGLRLEEVHRPFFALAGAA